MAAHTIIYLLVVNGSGEGTKKTRSLKEQIHSTVILKKVPKRGPNTPEIIRPPA